KYPTCYCTHRAIDGALDLLAGRPVRAEEVERVVVRISDYFATVLRNHAPETGLAAKFSIEFAMAGAIVARRVGLRELTDGFVRRPDVQALMRRVVTDTVREHDPALPGAAPADQVTIVLASGETLPGAKVVRATGHPSRLLSDQQIFEKFADCLEAGGSGIPAETLFGRLRAMHAMPARALAA
ncbi:MAG: MmgE/PrpD family protein, partial [Acetobacteraceae bacterium]|nr:MmgE/PrpD family protein [Acetobacteraceae bacterium]